MSDTTGVNTKHSMWPHAPGNYRCIYCGCRALSPEWYAECPRPLTPKSAVPTSPSPEQPPAEGDE